MLIGPLETNVVHFVSSCNCHLPNPLQLRLHSCDWSRSWYDQKGETATNPKMLFTETLLPPLGNDNG